MGRKNSLRLPVAPLERAAVGSTPNDELTVADVARMLGTTARNLHRYRDAGVTFPVADRLCTHLGLHPAMVWQPEEFNADLEAAARLEEIARYLTWVLASPCSATQMQIAFDVLDITAGLTPTHHPNINQWEPSHDEA